MNVFGDYARYYNVLYRDKDYSGETTFILNCLKRYGSCPTTLLDLGCGTGRHALEMSKRGISATGVDISTTMLADGTIPIFECSRDGCYKNSSTVERGCSHSTVE